MDKKLEQAYLSPMNDAEVIEEIRATIGDQKKLSHYRAVQVSKFVLGSFGVRMTEQKDYCELDKLVSELFELSLHYTIFGIRDYPYAYIPSAPSIGVEVMVRESEDGKTNLSADVVDELARLIREGENA